MGIAAGITVGMIPGFHVNNALPLFLFLGDAGVWFVVPMSVSYVFASFFPSILLGAPDEDTALSVLPGHRLLNEGKAYTALRLSFLGALSSSFILLFFAIPFAHFLPVLYPSLKAWMPYLLSIMLAFMLFSHRLAFVVILMSSALGAMTFSHNALLPLLTGFFGISTLLLSGGRNAKEQLPIYRPNISGFHIIRSSFIATLLASFFGLFPAISSGISAAAARAFGRMDSEEFLVLLGGTSMSYMVFSFLAFSLVQVTRSGSAVFLSQFGQANVYVLLGLCMVSSALSFLACDALSVKMMRAYPRIKAKYLNSSAIIFLIAANLLLSGLYGVAVLFAATAIGMSCQLMGVKRINCMAALIVPTVLVLW